VLVTCCLVRSAGIECEAGANNEQESVHQVKCQKLHPKVRQDEGEGRRGWAGF